jgi:hypothetical protein
MSDLVTEVEKYENPSLISPSTSELVTNWFWVDFFCTRGHRPPPVCFDRKKGVSGASEMCVGFEIAAKFVGGVF